MYTITLEESLARLDETIITRDEQYKKLRELIELTYKSGKHDGWYEAVEQHDK